MLKQFMAANILFNFFRLLFLSMEEKKRANQLPKEILMFILLFSNYWLLNIRMPFALFILIEDCQYVVVKRSLISTCLISNYELGEKYNIYFL